MSQNSEQIEAKLCAYLEGELDESGRAEIEKHLQQNPAHRKLLAEVGKTRNLLRALPREPAPPDICEAFQGQLERSVLLADLDDEGGSSSMKINRWPQYLAVAAVVLLAAGLGMVVYFGLPSGTRDGTYVIESGGASPAKTEDGPVTRSIAPVDNTSSLSAKPDTAPADFARSMGRDSDGAASFELAPNTLEKKKLAESVAGIPPATSGPAAAPAEELNVLARRVQGSWQLKERRDLFTAAGGSEATLQALDNLPDSTACYVVTTAQPGAAAEQIGRELSRLQVVWSAVPRPDPDALQMKLESRGGFGQVQQTEALQRELKDAAPADESVALAPDAPAQQPTAGAVFRGTRGDSAAGVGIATRQETVAGQSPATGTRAPATQPTQEFAAAADKESELADAVPALRARGFAMSPDGSGRAETLIVARGLTRRQAEVLRVSLDAAAPERQVAAFGARTGAADAKSLSDAPAVAEGVVEVGRRTGGGGGSGGPSPADGAVIQQGDALRLVTAREQGEQTVTEVQVAQNGTVTIPGIGLYRCEGLTLAQLQERVATDSRTVGASDVGKLVEVTKVERTKDAVAVPGEPGPLAEATESNVGQRGVPRARNDVMLRGGLERQAATAPAEEPLAAARPVSPPAPSRAAPAPTTPAPTTPAATAAPAAPAPRYTEGRGGAAGAAGMTPAPAATPQPGGAPDAFADKLAQAGRAPGVPTRSATSSATTSTATTGPAEGEERFDVVILVRDAAPAGAPDDLQHVDASGAAPEPDGPIAPYEILMIQLGDTEADLANVRVGDDGMVELPKVGRVKAAGLTATQLRDQIASKLPANAAEAKSSAITVKRLGNADASGSPAPDAVRPEPGPAAEQPAPGASAPDASSPAPRSPATPVETPPTDKSPD